MVSTVRTMLARISAEEWQTRLDLAACYRLVDLFGWSDLVNTRITARVPGQHGHFLINPYGLLFDEITASSLVKIDAEGNKVEPSESEIKQRRIRDTEHDPYGAARSRLRTPHPLDCRVRGINAKRRAAAAESARAADNRRHRLSRLRRRGPKRRGTSTPPRRPR